MNTMSFVGAAASLVYLALFWWCGWALARRALPRDGAEVLLPLSGAFCTALLAGLPAVFALGLGFTLPAVLAAGAAALGLGLWATLSRKQPAMPRPGKDLAALLACVLPLLAVTLWLLHTHVLLARDGAYWCGQSTYGDLPMHLAFIKSIAVRGQFPPIYPLLSGSEAFGYPYLSETVSSVFLLTGASLKAAYILPCIPALVSVFGSLWALGRSVLGGRGPASLAYWLFFMGSGFGFVYFLGGGWENFTRIFTAYYETPTNYVEENIRWVNPIADLLVPQRATLFGWAVGFACVYLLWRFAWMGERRLWGWLWLLAAPLPLLQAHAALVLVILAGAGFVFALIRDPRTKAAVLPWLAWAGAQAVVWIPLVFTQLMTGGQTGGSFFRWHWNWANEGDNYFWFYIKNIGLVYLLILPGFLWAGRKMRELYAGGLAILLLAEVMLFQPNPYDNNKLLYFWHLLSCLLAAGLVCGLAAKLRKKPARVLLVSVVVLLGCVGSVLTVGREWVSEYQQFGAAEAAVGSYVDENAPADAVFLTGTQHQNPVASLAGRQIVCGSSLYVYFHGKDYYGQAELVRQLYEQPSEELLAQLGVDFVMVGPWERSDYTALDEDFYRSRYTVWYEADRYSIYRITES